MVSDVRLSVQNVMFILNLLVLIFHSIIYGMAWKCSNCTNVL
jgi:hypothetical protein